MTRLLIVACSQAKRPDARSMEAIERYDGPTFRLLRKARGLGLLADTRIMILSAKYGLIPEYWMIDDYDQRMTPARAAELQPSVALCLWGWFHNWSGCYDVFINVGRSYVPALAGLEEWCVRRGIVVTQATGGVGERLVQTKAWLEGGV